MNIFLVIFIKLILLLLYKSQNIEKSKLKNISNLLQSKISKCDHSNQRKIYFSFKEDILKTIENEHKNDTILINLNKSKNLSDKYHNSLLNILNIYNIPNNLTIEKVCGISCPKGTKIIYNFTLEDLDCQICPENTFSTGGYIRYCGMSKDWTEEVFKEFGTKCYIKIKIDDSNKLRKNGISNYKFITLEFLGEQNGFFINEENKMLTSQKGIFLDKNTFNNFTTFIDFYLKNFKNDNLFNYNFSNNTSLNKNLNPSYINYYIKNTNLVTLENNKFILYNQFEMKNITFLSNEILHSHKDIFKSIDFDIKSEYYIEIFELSYSIFLRKNGYVNLR